MVRPLWWIPILLCFAAGIVFLIPADGATGPTLAYDALIPLAPLSSILIWIVGILIYGLARWSTRKPMRPM